MNKSEIMDVLSQHPHTTKTMRLADGQALEIRHPDQVSFPDERLPRVCAVFPSSGGFRLVSLDQIVSVDMPAIPTAPGANP